MVKPRALGLLILAFSTACTFPDPEGLILKSRTLLDLLPTSGFCLPMGVMPLSSSKGRGYAFDLSCIRETPSGTVIRERTAGPGLVYGPEGITLYP